MPPKIIPLEGKKIGVFTVINYAGSKLWNCECECGALKIIPGYILRRGTKSICESCGTKFKYKEIREKTFIDRDKVSYLAGILDGEGCLSLSNRGKYITPTVQVTNTSLDLIKWLKETCGGTYYEGKIDPRGNRKKVYLWCCAGRVARDIVEAVLPFLIVKNQQALLILESYKSIARKPGRDINGRLTAVMSDEEIHRNKDAIFRMRILNKRGVEISVVSKKHRPSLH